MSRLEWLALLIGLSVLCLALAAKPVEELLRRLRRRRRAARRHRRESLETLRAEQARQGRLAKGSASPT